MDAFVETFVLGGWQANCYVLGDHDAGTAVVIDPGADASEAVIKACDRHQVRLEAILLTHGHLDHLWSAPALARSVDAPVFLHPDDRWLWTNPAQGFGPLPPEVLEEQFGLRWDTEDIPSEVLRDGMRLGLACCDIEVRHTPGHTPGSCVFLLAGTDDLAVGPEPGTAFDLRVDPGTGLLFSGDLLFAGSVGRTDLPRGSHADLLRSIEEQVLGLPDDTVVAAGHGLPTTVGEERRTNPFLR